METTFKKSITATFELPSGNTIDVEIFKKKTYFDLRDKVFERRPIKLSDSPSVLME